MFLEVFVEGASDAPVVDEILSRRFRLVKNQDFRIISHRGKGRLPHNPNSRPDPQHRGLLDQLPAKLRGCAHWPESYHIVVLVDADRDDCRDLLDKLQDMYRRLEKKPRNVLFRIAVEETESWFIADQDAVKAAYPKADTRLLSHTPDQVIGAWEMLAKTIKENPAESSGADKRRWAENIAPHLDLEQPCSPSLKAFIRGVGRITETARKTE